MRYAYNLENLVKSSRTKVTSILLCTFLSILLSYAYYCFGSMIEFSVSMGSSSLSHVVLVPVSDAKNESTFGLYRPTQGACWSYHAWSYCCQQHKNSLSWQNLKSYFGWSWYVTAFRLFENYGSEKMIWKFQCIGHENSSGYILILITCTVLYVGIYSSVSFLLS